MTRPDPAPVPQALAPEAAVARAATAGAGGVIYDIGYRGYDGPRLGRRSAVWALFAFSFRAAFGLGRSGRAKVVPWGALAIISLPAVVQSAVIATAGPLGARAGGGFTYDNYLFRMNLLALVFLAAQAPELLVGDQRQRVLSLYFAHALERVDYALAKLAAMVASLLVVAVVPMLVLFLGQTFAASDPFGSFRDQLGSLPGIMGSAAVYVLIYAAVGMSITAFTPRRAYATAAIVAVFLVGSAVSPLLRRAGAGIGDWTILLNVNTVAEGVRHTLFGGEPNGAVATASLDGVAYVGMALAVVAVGVVAYLWRYQRIQP
jgi:ABC-2 type transport system permease protein